MPMHDWTRVTPVVFRAFHHGWIASVSDSLNTRVLPDDYYALAERSMVGNGPWEKNAIAVRHVDGDRTVAMLDVVTPGDKSSGNALAAMIEKEYEFLERGVHLLIADPFPPSTFDPNSVHAAIWQKLSDDSFRLPPDKPLTLVAYACDDTMRAYVEPFDVGDALPEMPLFLAPQKYVNVPLEETYQAAYAALPRRWRHVLD